MQLKGAEDAKIAYAKQYFSALSDNNVVYDCIDRYNGLIEKVLG